MTELSFEKALEKLEGIVKKMEEGGLSLNDSLILFEKGVKLSRFLREELEKTEKKIEILLKDEKGKVKAQPFRLEATSSKEEGSDSGDDNDPPF
ncbi:MAG: exodeoxyribonuclease VII small subunit [Acidobacteriota bacterium]|nr:exodeoxyribonuclease VII small subunit [Acidobacteriota bacterium]